MLNTIKTSKFKNYKFAKKMIIENENYKIVNEIFKYNSGYWKAPIPKNSDIQIIEYKEI
tara:strand:- start:339 stop:515 length:177 start_codon:yes stop_codon:yes gene_type:complete